MNRVRRCVVNPVDEDNATAAAAVAAIAAIAPQCAVRCHDDPATADHVVRAGVTVRSVQPDFVVAELADVENRRRQRGVEVDGFASAEIKIPSIARAGDRSIDVERDAGRGAVVAELQFALGDHVDVDDLRRGESITQHDSATRRNE